MANQRNTPDANTTGTHADHADGKPFAVQAPQIALPKGGGAIHGIGEKFNANPVTGTGAFTVPIATSPGRAGFGPQLSLSYDSGAGNNVFGLGWNLSAPTITRRTDKGLPQYRDAIESDVYVLSGAEDLVPELTQDANGQWSKVPLQRDGYTVQRYRPRIEGLFSRIERWTRNSDGDIYWRVIGRDNVTAFFGRDAASRIADPADPTRVFSWLLCDSRDDKGNAMRYQYVAEDSANLDLNQVNERNRSVLSRSANRYLKRILYGNTAPVNLTTDLSTLSWLFEVVFDYGEGHVNTPRSDADGRTFVNASLNPTQSWPLRQDPFSRHRAGFEVRTYRLCRRVLMFHHFAQELGTPDCLVHTTEFNYRETPVATYLSSVTQTGLVRQADGSYLQRSLPPIEFEYSQAQVQSAVREVDPDSLANLPAAVDGTLYQWLDLDGEGVPGVLVSHDDSWYYKRNLSPLTWQVGTPEPSISARFETMIEVASLPGYAYAGLAGHARHQFMDLAGDGHRDCVVFDQPYSGFYKRTDHESWESFTALAATPNIDWQDPNLRFIDLDGDGIADLLITEHDAFTWYPSLGEQGFDSAQRVDKVWDEEQGPAVVFADGTQTMFLADMCGDGLTDIVRIRNGEVCYWPNLGYGRFGARISMDNAPWFDTPDTFDARRIRLTDIDGCGTTDIIYLAADGVHLYFNQAGNLWSAPAVLPVFPPVDNLSTVQAMDLLGNGTACLVWMSPLPGATTAPMRYVELMGAQKPHLLIRCVNNMGAETRVHYAPSTRFYLSDRAAGTPWQTRLPFPVQVVERVETCDLISRNRFVTRYAYHHGYYDGFEREFRGFGMVEQFDTEELGVLLADGSFPAASNLDAASYVPPMLSKTWYHVGAYPQGPAISRMFHHEYYRESLSDAEFAAMLLPDSILPPDLSPDEVREALRSLKGSMLRHEVYALDGSDAAARPYSVAEANLTIKRLQPTGPNRHAVFFTHARESIDLHYERKLYQIGSRQLADPRTTHNMVLAIDDYGNPLQVASIAYGRRHDDPDPLLTDDDRLRQRQLHIAYVCNAYTNAVQQDDAYRSPMPAESRNYTLINLAPAGTTNSITNLFEFAEMAAALNQLDSGQNDLSYADVEASAATGAHPYRRLTAHSRTCYRKNDLSAALPLGSVESLALGFERYQLALDSSLLKVFQRNGQDLQSDLPTLLTSQGGYAAGDTLKNTGLFPATDVASQWWAASGRSVFSSAVDATAADELSYAQQHFFTERCFTDVFGNMVTVEYDQYDLLVLETVDAVQNKITVGSRNADGTIRSGFDYRVLQPNLVTDANGNRAAVVFDCHGMVAGSAVMGKDGETVGDTLDGFIADPTEAQLAQFLLDPKGAAGAALLANATARNIYDMFRYMRGLPDSAQPVYAATIAREQHVSALAAGETTKLQISLHYSDGYGRTIQNKLQTGPGALQPGGQQVAQRWITTGWTIFNNKGNPVRQYEAFFDDSIEFKFGVKVGVSSIVFYDPAQRAVATLNPDHTWKKTVFDPWHEEHWDVNDMVLVDPTQDAVLADFAARLPTVMYAPSWYAQRESGAMGAAQQDAAKKAAVHAGTPAMIYFDALARHMLSVAWNRDASVAPPVEERPRTVSRFDSSGRQLAVIDALQRTVMRYRYDLLGKVIYQSSMDAGERWNVDDALGKNWLHWDSRKMRFRHTYDAARRLTGLLMTPSDGATEILLEKTVYGEGQPDAQNKNMRGKIFQNFDGAGCVTHLGYDFKGNLLSSARQLLQNYASDVDWQASAAPPMETDVFATASTFDALNRTLTVTTPDASAYQIGYDEASMLNTVAINLQGAQQPTPLVLAIVRDAKGRRESIRFGNGIGTDYSYDPDTFRLIRQTTTSATGKTTIQDLVHTYDPVGNLVGVRDNADYQKTVYFANQQVEACANYRYDALYRLIQSSGREHLGQNNSVLNSPNQVSASDQFRIGLPQPGDGMALANYLEAYRYDSVGNLLTVDHTVSSGNWRRGYLYDTGSNRLLGSTLPGDGAGQFSARYSYDEHGNMATMPHLPLMQWDSKNQLRCTQQQVVNDGPGERTYYVYDASGERVRKVTESASGTKLQERIYLGAYEIYRKYSGTTVSLERQTLHAMDDKRRIVLIETRSQGDDGTAKQLLRYQISNHLESACVELDDSGQLISYEEYFPYGGTAYQSVNAQLKAAAKRYRFTGVERDEENGLSYHSRRYLIPWLGRWSAPDPTGLKDGINLYAYVNDNPTGLIDHSGLAGGKGDPQMWFVEYVTRLNPAKAIATRSGRGFTTALRQWKTKMVDLWGGPARTDLVHLDKPFSLTKAGETQNIGIGERTANREMGALEREQTQLAKSKGQFGRAGKVDTTAKKGVKVVQPEPPAIKSISTKSGAAAHDAVEVGKAVEKEAKTAVKVAVKETEKEAVTVAVKTAVKEATHEAEKTVLKEGAKVVGKKALKFVPFVGVVVGISLVSADAHAGDFKAAAWDAAEAIPVVGDVVGAGHLGLSTGEAASAGLGIDKVAAEHGMAVEGAARWLGASQDTAVIIGATGAALSSITVAPTIAVKRLVEKWF